MVKEQRLLSIVLAVLMLCSVFVVAPITANAATSHTKDEAISWVQSKLGQKVGSGQCVALITAYYSYLGVSPVSGNGSDYTGNDLPSGWQRLQGAQPQKGDILVYTGGDNNYGHVAIYESDYVTYHQNFGNNQTVQKVTYKYNAINNPYWGVIRPDFTGIYPTVGDNKNYVKVNEEIEFWYSGLSECSKAEFYFEDGNGKKYYTKESTSSRFFKTYFEKEGLYRVYAGGLYNGNWYYSSKITVYVFNPNLTVNKTAVDVNEEITFTYSGLSACQQVKICFEKNGTLYYAGDSTSSRTYKNYFTNPGEYYVYAEGKVNDYTTSSDKVKITVKSKNDETTPSSSSESQPTESTETQPVTDKPTETIETQPVTDKTTVPVETQSITDIPSEPNETQPVTDNPTAPTQPIETNPVETQPVTNNPTDSTVTEPTTDTPTDPGETQPVTDNPTAPTQPIETNPVETQPAKTDISKWNVSGITSKTYTGKVIKQNDILVSKDGKYADFSVKYKNNVNVGMATVILTGTGDYTGTITKSFKINKAANPIKVTAKKTVNAKAKKKTTINNSITVKNAKGKVTYKTNNKKVTIKNGKIIVAKGFKKGKTIKVKITVTAKGTSNYKSKNIVKTIKVKIK